MTHAYEAGRLIAGRYEVEAVLGTGGMGVVVAARDRKLGHRVALKFLHPRAMGSHELVTRFHREARALAGLQSDHVARVLDTGVDEQGMPFMVMELLEGEDVGERLDRSKVMPIDEAVTIIIEACDAIGEAHAKGIVHRDLKPANLFLARRPSGARVVKVLDFGISKLLEAEPTSRTDPTLTGATILGSPLYMSPEQLRSTHEVDGRADIYALGATLYEMLTGCPPFSSPSVPELCAMIFKDDPRAPSTLRPEVSAALDAVVLRMIARDREHRFASAAELAFALAPFTEGRLRSISIPPPPLLPALERRTDEASLTQTAPSGHPPSPLVSTMPPPPPRAPRRWPAALLGGIALGVFALLSIARRGPDSTPAGSLAAAPMTIAPEALPSVAPVLLPSASSALSAEPAPVPVPPVAASLTRTRSSPASLARTPREAASPEPPVLPPPPSAVAPAPAPRPRPLDLQLQ